MKRWVWLYGLSNTMYMWRFYLALRWPQSDRMKSCSRRSRSFCTRLSLVWMEIIGQPFVSPVRSHLHLGKWVLKFLWLQRSCVFILPLSIQWWLLELLGLALGSFGLKCPRPDQFELAGPSCLVVSTPQEACAVCLCWLSSLEAFVSVDVGENRPGSWQLLGRLPLLSDLQPQTLKSCISTIR